jgi:hypothetical protein
MIEQRHGGELLSEARCRVQGAVERGADAIDLDPVIGPGETCMCVVASSTLNIPASIALRRS